MPDLSQIRREIDKIDTKLRSLLRKRAEKSLKVKEIKELNKTSVENPEREEEILNKCKTDYEKIIFKKILEQSRELQSQSLLKRPFLL